MTSSAVLDDLRSRFEEWLASGKDRFEPDQALDGLELLEEIAVELGWATPADLGWKSV